MKNIINFLTFVLCIVASSVNAQNTTISQSTSILFSQGFSKVANVVEDVDTEDGQVRNIAMMQEEFSPEAAPAFVATAALVKGFHTVANVVEDVDTEDVYVRNAAMMQEEFSPEVPETNFARTTDEVTAKY